MTTEAAEELLVYRSMLEQHRKQLEVTEAALADERETNHALRTELEALRKSGTHPPSLTHTHTHTLTHTYTHIHTHTYIHIHTHN